MKIRTITCHDVYNYGASLQAFALQNYLTRLGHDYEIIDFKPYYQQERYNLFYIGKTSRFYPIVKKYPFLKLIYGPLKNYRIFKTYGRKIKFDHFKHAFLKLTPQHYTKSEGIQKDPPMADIYIAGSDQIWNTDIPNGNEPGYYLEFGKSDTIRVSYAASFGITSLPDKLKPCIKNRLAHFQYISVREKTGLAILSDLQIPNVEIVLDPVFLLDKTEWEQLFIKPNKYPKYILVYDFIDDQRIRDIALSLKQKTDYKIYSLNDWQELDYADKNINDAGPIEFLNLIYYAEYIICNSFHGTAFSILFEKDFYSYSLSSQNTSSRILDLLKDLELDARYNQKNATNSSINYKKALGILHEKKEQSKQFINKFTHYKIKFPINESTDIFH